MFGAALDGRYAWLAALAAVNSVASVFYYLRWIVPAFGRPSAPVRPERRAFVVAVVLAALSVLLGIGSGAVLAA